MTRAIHEEPAISRPTIIDVAAARVSKSLVSLVLRGCAPAKRRALDTLLELRIDGLILAGPMPELNAIVLAIKEVPIVLVSRRARLSNVDSVSNDDSADAALVVQHLAGLGHRSIAHIDGGGSSGAVGRRTGYVRAMQRCGLDAHTRVIPGSDTDESGRHGVATLFDGDSPQPTAIFVANDLAALGAMSALAERALRVPKDVSVVGYDNTALAADSQFNLTSVDQPRPAMGRTAVTLLLERLVGRRDGARHVILPPTLVVRGTTAQR